MTIDPATVGRATEYRTIDLGKIPGRLDAAPLGYEWADLPPTMFGIGGALLLCCRCAALVGMAEAHDAWHDKVERPSGT